VRCRGRPAPNSRSWSITATSSPKTSPSRRGSRGIFTLGEEHVGAAKKVEELKETLARIGQEIQGLKVTLAGSDGRGGKAGELAALEDKLKDACWQQKQKHDGAFRAAFEGCRNSAEKFKKKLLQERASAGATLERFEVLQSKAATIFAPAPAARALLPPIDDAGLAALEADPVLGKRVVGKDDVDVGAMIVRLGNSDWVKRGREYHAANDRVCPFCQQPTAADLIARLDEYFDETFTRDTRAIELLASKYSSAVDRLKRSFDAILAADCPFLDADKLRAEREIIDGRTATNAQRLMAKTKEPSQVVALETAAGPLATARALVDAANEQVAAHNTMVANISQERATLTAQVWKFLIAGELKDALGGYDEKKADIEKAVTSLNEQIRAREREYRTKLDEVRALEKNMTSIQPTSDAVNQLLHSFGFRGFKLAKVEEEPAYKIVRGDGTDAKESLSEGEKTFITFLYFYHLLKGSHSDGGGVTDRVVVIDDPVSSLDSDILFIVSSLIKALCEEVRAGTTNVRQVFVLTHNVYFHKEVTFNAKRRGGKMREETFWTVRKYGEQSRVVGHSENPITSYYDMLWADVRRGDRDNHSIQNTLRKILENYFKFFGGVEPETICSQFDGADRLICKSLLSWVNDGSHFAQDDLYHSIDDALVERYLCVFRLIFEKTKHLAHYEMMMRVASDDE
jgi:wobble nucleotide-excising tRNase